MSNPSGCNVGAIEALPRIGSMRLPSAGAQSLQGSDRFLIEDAIVGVLEGSDLLLQCKLSAYDGRLITLTQEFLGLAAFVTVARLLKWHLLASIPGRDLSKSLACAVWASMRFAYTHCMLGHMVVLSWLCKPR